MKTCYLIFFLFITLCFQATECCGQTDSHSPDSVTIAGTVVDENGEPVVHAVVFIKDRNKILIAVITDLDGRFSLRTFRGIESNPFAKIDVQYVGHIMKPLKVAETLNTRSLILTLRRDPNSFSEHPPIYKVPLIERFEGGNSKTITAEEIEGGAY